jgi:hypothetical protein
MQSNLYAFGCSFAQYSWPMWPEILAQCYNTTENYGHPGSGNFYIFHQVLYCLLNKQVSKEDTVIIQWTESNRTDYIENKDWANSGSLSAELLIKSRLDFMISDETSAIKTLSYMVILIKLLEEIGCNWYFIFMSPQCKVHKFESKDFINLNIKKRYESFLSKINLYKHRFIDTTMTEFFEKNNMPINKCSWKVKNKVQIFEDDHPLPSYTFKYINEILNVVLKKDLKKSKIFVDQVSLLIDNYKIIDTEILSKDLIRLYKLSDYKITKDGRA